MAALRQVALICVFLAATTAACSLMGGLGAGVGTAISAPIIGMTAKSVVATADESARRVMADARNAGDALAIRAANELQVAAMNVTGALGDEIDKSVRSLSIENQRLVAKLEELRLQAMAIRHDAFKLKDSTALDLKVLLGDTWFAKKHDFWVQRIDGITQLENKFGADYKLTIQGLGFGPDSDDRRSEIVEVLGPTGPLAYSARDVGAFTTEVDLLHAGLQPSFLERKVNVLPLDVKVRVSRLSAGTWRSRIVELPLSITLMPKFGGSARVVYFYTEGVWSSAGERRFSATTPNCHRDDTDNPKSAFSTSAVLPSTLRFVAGTARWRSVGGEGCAWHSDQNVSIGEGGQRLTFSETCDGSPCNYEYWADVESLDEDGAVRMAETTVSFNFGEYLVIPVPSTTGFWAIDGSTSTLQPINLVTGQSGPILIERPAITLGSEKRLIFYAQDPAVLQ